MNNGLRRSAFVCALTLAASSLTLGCGKVQSMLGKGGDAGASEASGGLFGSLKKDEGLSFLSSFEGQIDLSVKSNKPGKAPLNVALLVKDKKLRADLPDIGMTGQSFKGFAVVDGPQKKAFVVTDTPEKAVIVFDMNRAGEQLKTYSPSERAKSFGATPKETKPPKVTKTGKKDQVAGHQCEEWLLESDEGKASLCVAKQGFSWLQIPLAGAPAEYTWAGELLDGSHVPLRLIAMDKAGAETMRAEVTKIDKKPLAANLFEIPPGYPQLTLEQMIAKMMQGMGAARGLPSAMPPFPKPKQR